MTISLGPIALLGSGESSIWGGRLFELIAQRLPIPLHVSILETPAGFELNSNRVAGRVADFIRKRLANFHPILNVIPARRRDGIYGTENPDVLAPLRNADLIFMGPGSPTYAVRMLDKSLAWDIIRARNRLGAALVFSSAATIAAGAWVLPVYEIFKVGEDVFSLPGLNLFKDFNLNVSVIPHWNNSDGGSDVDTERCFVGKGRFEQWLSRLPGDQVIIGLDEHTSAILDFTSGMCSVNGVNSVTILRNASSAVFLSGKKFSISELGNIHIPSSPEQEISNLGWELASMKEDASDKIPVNVRRLADLRQNARLEADWIAADNFRDELKILGWLIDDRKDGYVLKKSGE